MLNLLIYSALRGVRCE